VIIFCATKRLCEQLARGLVRSFGVVAIHGDKSQGEQDHVLQQFHDGRAPILVATDVAAHGFDIKDIRFLSSLQGNIFFSLHSFCFLTHHVLCFHLNILILE
jgi:superfamily II DNA/RNA helicase